jgi:hypothetical protein
VVYWTGSLQVETGQVKNLVPTDSKRIAWCPFKGTAIGESTERDGHVATVVQ